MIQNQSIYPSWHSLKVPLILIGIICLLISGVSLYMIADAPRGITWDAVIFFTGIPIGLILIPTVIIFLSYKIRITGKKIVFYMFFLPVKTVDLSKIRRVSFNRIASNGQRCAMTVEYDGGKFIYPVRLFKENLIAQLIEELDAQCRPSR